MEKRLLVAMLLSFAVIYGYSFLFPPAKVEAPQGANVAAPKTQAPPAVAPSDSPPQVPVVAVAGVRDVTVDTDLYTAVFSTQGGTLRRLVLKKYRDTPAVDAPPVTLVDVRPEDAPLQTAVSGLYDDRQLVYGVNRERTAVKGDATETIVFSASLPGGGQVEKHYRLKGDSYQFHLETVIRNGSKQPITGYLELRQADPFVKQKSSAMDMGMGDEISAPVNMGGKIHHHPLKDIQKQAISQQGDILWSAFGSKYFVSAVIGQPKTIASVKMEAVGDSVRRAVATPPFTVAPGASAVNAFSVFYGPKDIDVLKATGVGLEESIDLGWFSMIAKPLLLSLKFFYRYVHNYGLSIIIITFILKIFFYPLTHSSYKSMKEMQKLQPKMAQIREKNKDDRDAMNRAIMELYRDHKVNPMGGCLPMLVQIPVFFALYKALMFSIELRHAPFYFWITDLSAKDPYYITPIIMGATMVIQQKMTPTTMDPMQAKIMMFLPVVFTFMFLNFPSGLVLYWLVNNILTILQQWRINHTLKEA
jgi:YidC/Oxa1 family membrane protein insertase